jgi:hypothetical protein
MSFVRREAKVMAASYFIGAVTALFAVSTVAVIPTAVWLHYAALLACVLVTAILMLAHLTALARSLRASSLYVLSWSTLWIGTFLSQSALTEASVWTWAGLVACTGFGLYCTRESLRAVNPPWEGAETERQDAPR